jgi:thiamine-phosphate pyrophosphorylase
MWDPSLMDYACSMSFSFPKVYPILDAGTIPQAERAKFLRRLGAELAEAGVTLLEYRNKSGSDAELLADAVILRAALPGPDIKLILDDRVDLVEQAGFDGVHVDAGDATPAEARRLLGPERIVGTFGGTETLVPGVLEEPVDYLSIGPIFPTATKQTTKAPMGVAGVRKLREQAGPNVVLVAVGGVRLDKAQEILAAGANVIGVSAAIFRAKDPAGEFRRWLHALE